MKKIISFLFVVAVVLVLAPLNAKAVSFKMSPQCSSTQKDPNDSTRSYTDCNIVIDLTGGSTDTTSAKFTVTYNEPNAKSDFEIIEETSGLVTSDITKTTDGGSFNFDFNSGLSGSFTAFKIRFYADSTLSGKDCGGLVSMEYNGTTTTTTTSTNTEAKNPNTGVSVPVIALGVGVVACLAVYASTSKKTKMHRI